MDVETYGEVFPSPLSQRGSVVFLLQADQNLILWFRHVKHILQPRRKSSQHTRLVQVSIDILQLWRKSKRKEREEMKRHLGVLKKGAPVVDAAPSSVEKRLVVVAPGAPHRGLLPRLMHTQV